MSNEKISTGHRLYDGTVVFTDGAARGYTVWALDERDAMQALVRRGVQDRELACWVETVRAQ